MTGLALKYSTEIISWKESLMNYLFSATQLEQRLQMVIAADSITDLGIHTEAYLTMIEAFVDRGHALSTEIIHQQALLVHDGKLIEDSDITDLIRKEQSRLRDDMSDVKNEYVLLSKETTDFLKRLHS
jgi:hypothetical protein